MLNIEKLKAYEIPDTHMTLTRRDTLLYAVGVGYGSDPESAGQLQYCMEKDLRTLPTLATVVAAPHGWMRKADVGSSGRSVHAGIHVRLHRPLPPEGTFVCHSLLGEIIDKGEGKAALVATERRVHLEGDADPVFEITSVSMQRGDGGFGGKSRPDSPDPEMPGRSHDHVCQLPTYPNQALIYRLSGDYNPLHSDPEVARRQGFPRPILHGLCTFGVAGHALIRTLCEYDAARLVEIGGRFSGPVYPGETLRTLIWRDGDTVQFRVCVPERDNAVVFDFGTARLA